MDWEIFIFHFCNLFSQKMEDTFLPKKKKKSKKKKGRSTGHIIGTRYTGNIFFLGWPYFKKLGKCTRKDNGRNYS